MNLRHLFRVETLDARFASPTGQPLPHAQPSKWNTREYFVYYAAFLTIPFFMFKAVYDVSQPGHPSYQYYEHLLQPGWIPGRNVDNSDAQYASFRDNLPYMALVLVLHPILRTGYEKFLAVQPGKISLPDARLQRRTTFDVAFAAIFLLALHGISAFKVLAILALNYQIATALPRRHAGWATWVFNIGILFANELCKGYRFADLASFFLPAETTAAGGGQSTANWGTHLDSYGGLIPRWEILFNITVLRLIAFNFDYLWSQDRRAGSPIEKKNLDPTALSERDRIASGANPADYTPRHYIAYTLYSPLYLAGPILTFNDYIAQTRQPLPTVTNVRPLILPYALRFLISLLTMELLLHYLHPLALAHAQPPWSLFTPFQLSMLGYFHLHLIWLKLLLPWRLFRLWSLVDAVDPPENMLRCMSDNYSALAFWRGWHRSFNRWVVRYIYVPLISNNSNNNLRTPFTTYRIPPALRSASAYFAVFTFVALWHDINLRLLLWGWLIILFILPEVLLRTLLPPSKFPSHPLFYRWLAGTGAVGNILMMMAANLVGFAVGLEGLQGLVRGILEGWAGRGFFLAACGTLFVGAQVMFEWRESERRRGVGVKC